ncbi:transketolase [Algisphaera agarilytica]|uniref:Transketolase n=1 Tax=Algisphaera agarilytica TaxID=1385975 RepID=A0A7X0LJA5_9BACT|nr:transketolase [Algisphaera agarilytica]MBB6428401.1 transketolase [Algisphaera agarilytica]
MSLDSTLHQKSVDLAKLTYQITGSAGSGHPSTGASLVHLISALLYTHMRHEPANPGHPSADRLVLSEGHAVPVVYAAMADLGIHYRDANNDLKPVTRDLAMTLRQLDSPIDGHPNPALGMPFFDAATGSLGQGLSVAAGLAVAAKLDGLDKRIFCIMGDGESREGQIWEAVDFIRDHDLKAVCPIFNANAFGQTSEVSPQQSADTLVKKLEAAGYEVLDIDGHQPSAIVEALSTHAQKQHDPEAAPVAIVARTVKGWGSASQQGNGHHGTAPTGEALDAVLEELSATERQIGAAADTPLKIPMLPADKPEAATHHAVKSFDDALKAFGMESVLEKGKLATRKAYGIALRAAGHAHSNVVALDAEVSNSTGADAFKKDDALASRFVECKIAEQNMLSAALGMSAAGKVPFVSTFGKFMVRAYDQIEMAILSGKPIKLVGSHAGATLGADGPSQMALCDVAFARSFATMRTQTGHPGMVVLTPSDAYQCYALVQQMAEYEGFAYLRTLRPDTEFLYGPEDEFVLGGHELLIEGRDLLILASGYMVHEANRALEQLDEAGIDATLVDMYSLPFDEEAIADLANENNGMVLTLEDNYGNAMGSAVADALSATGDGFTINQMHVKHLPKSGQSPDELLRYCNLSSEHIVQQAMSMLELSAT